MFLKVPITGSLISKMEKIDSESSSAFEDSDDEFRPPIKSEKQLSESEDADSVRNIGQKSVQHEKGSFSEILDSDGVWRSGPFFANFRKEEMEKVIRLSSRTVSNVTDFVLPKFEKAGSKFGAFDVTNQILNDFLKWSCKMKGKPVVKPRKRVVSLEGGEYEVTNFCSPLTMNFKKFTIRKPSDTTIHVVYVSSCSRHFYDDLKDHRKNRLSDDMSKEIREALSGQSVKSAFENLKKRHPEIREKQVRNMARSVADCVKKNRGPVPVTVPEVLAQLQTTTRGAYFNSKGKDYQFVYVDKDMMSLYVKSLPTRINIQNYKETLDRSENWSTEDVNSFIEYHSKNANSGTIEKMSGQLQIDCTFDLSDCVVTIVSCDLTGFTTRSSSKTRHSCLGFMISSSKKRDCHEFFANCLHQEFLNLDPRLLKAIPVVITDGESALSEYTSKGYFDDTVVLRCSVHRRDNLTRENSVSDTEIREIFGTVSDDGKLNGGLFDVMNMRSFQEKIENSGLSESVKNWLTERKEDLFNSHSLYKRLQSGVIMQYVTTNRIENFNSKIKNYFSKPVNGKRCAEKLVVIIDEEKDRLADAILNGNDEFIVYNNYRNSENSSGFDRSKILQKVGFSKSSVAQVLKIPKSLWKNCQEEDLKLNDVFQLEVTVKSDDKFLVQKIRNSEEAVTVQLSADSKLICKNAKCFANPNCLCVHILSTSAILPVKQRAMCWNAIEQNLKIFSRKETCRNNNSGKAARRFNKRKYTTNSRNNGDRTVQGYAIAETVEFNETSVYENTTIFSPKNGKKNAENAEKTTVSRVSDFSDSEHESLHATNSDDTMTNMLSNEITGDLKQKRPSSSKLKQQRSELSKIDLLSATTAENQKLTQPSSPNISLQKSESDSDSDDCATFRRLQKYVKKLDASGPSKRNTKKPRLTETSNSNESSTDSHVNRKTKKTTVSRKSTAPAPLEARIMKPYHTRSKSLKKSRI